MGTVLASDVGRGSEAFSKVKRQRGALSTLIDQNGVGQMLANRTALTYADKRPTWVAIVKFLLLVVFVVALFLLAQSMVRHRFHRGGWINHHDTLRP